MRLILHSDRDAPGAACRRGAGRRPGGDLLRGHQHEGRGGGTGPWVRRRPPRSYREVQLRLLGRVAEADRGERPRRSLHLRRPAPDGRAAREEPDRGRQPPKLCPQCADRHQALPVQARSLQAGRSPRPSRGENRHRQPEDGARWPVLGGELEGPRPLGAGATEARVRRECAPSLGLRGTGRDGRRLRLHHRRCDPARPGRRSLPASRGYVSARDLSGGHRDGVQASGRRSRVHRPPHRAARANLCSLGSASFRPLPPAGDDGLPARAPRRVGRCPAQRPGRRPPGRRHAWQSCNDSSTSMLWARWRG